jgi:anti-anti-sigma factor
MLDFEKEMSGDILIEKVNLTRATTVEAGIIKKRLFEDIHISKKKIIVDMSNCLFIDEIFLGALVIAFKKSREAGGKLKVVITPKVVEKTPTITGFLKVVESFSTVEDAIKSFRA